VYVYEYDKNIYDKNDGLKLSLCVYHTQMELLFLIIIIIFYPVFPNVYTMEGHAFLFTERFKRTFFEQIRRQASW
jgi:hypothetical protein